MNSEELGALGRGKETKYVKGIRIPGECIYVSTDKGIMELRECVERQIGRRNGCEPQPRFRGILYVRAYVRKVDQRHVALVDALVVVGDERSMCNT